jgi:hypothetical protein
MTLVLSVATPIYCLQVSDRLLSVNGKPFDRSSNKNVLFLCPEGFLTLGYTGPAFLRGIPTDVRIAGALTKGAALERRAMRFGGDVEVATTEEAIELVRKMLQKHSSFGRRGGEVVAVGWCWKGGDLRRMLWEITGAESRERQLIPEDVDDTREGLVLSSAGDSPFKRTEEQEICKQLVEAGNNLDSAEQVLVQAIRKAAGRKGTIGPNCMSIALPRSGAASLSAPRIRFLPQDTQIAITSVEHVEVGFSPWVIAPGTMAPPSHVVGNQTLHGGGFEVLIEGPEPPPNQSLRAAFGSEIRSRAPGWTPHPHSIPHPWEQDE